VTEKVLFAVLVSSEFLAAVSMVYAAKVRVTYFELALLAEDVYKENSENRGDNGWNPTDNQSENTYDSGLQIQNYQNDNHPNHTVIAKG
jgi:hypothetical protein